MLKHIKIIALGIGIGLLTACASSPEVKEAVQAAKVEEQLSSKLVSVELYVIKLYSETYTDSGVLFNDISTSLKSYEGTDIPNQFTAFGKASVETKIPLIQIQNMPSEYILATNTGYVKEIKKNKIIPDFYSDGIKAVIESNVISPTNIAVKYSIDVERVIRIEKNKSNKLIDIPILNKRTFSQSMVFTNNEYIVAGIMNTIPKQFEVIVLKAKMRN